MKDQLLLFRKALKINKIDPNYVQLIEKKERSYVDFILSSMSKYIDVVIPRGGKNLITKIGDELNYPFFIIQSYPKELPMN